jgi:hypothetical protein
MSCGCSVLVNSATVTSRPTRPYKSRTSPPPKLGFMRVHSDCQDCRCQRLYPTSSVRLFYAVVQEQGLAISAYSFHLVRWEMLPAEPAPPCRAVVVVSCRWQHRGCVDPHAAQAWHSAPHHTVCVQPGVVDLHSIASN